MALHRLDVDSFTPFSAINDGGSQKKLADDVEARSRQQMMDVGNTAATEFSIGISQVGLAPEIAPSASSNVAQQGLGAR